MQLKALNATATCACATTSLLGLQQATTKKRKGTSVDVSVTTSSMEDQDEQAAAAKKRLQYKLYQRRHRAKQHDKARLLETQVAQLTQEIAILKQIHETAMNEPTAGLTLATRHTLAGPPAQLVREYFRLFEHGYSFTNSDTQAAFVRASMAADVHGVYISGTDELLDQWHRYSQVFAAVHTSVRELSATRLDQQQTLITVATTWRLRVQRVGVLSVFPSIQGRDDILEDLVGNPLTVEGTLRFVVDAANRVRWLGAEMAFAEAMARSVGSFANAGLCLQDALLDASTGFIKTSRHAVDAGTTSVKVNEEMALQDAPPTCTSRLDLSYLLSGLPQ
jgi:hypothetical protein